VSFCWVFPCSFVYIPDVWVIKGIRQRKFYCPVSSLGIFHFFLFLTFQSRHIYVYIYIHRSFDRIVLFCHSFPSLSPFSISHLLDSFVFLVFTIYKKLNMQVVPKVFGNVAVFFLNKISSHNWFRPCLPEGYNKNRIFNSYLMYELNIHDPRS
jgi:hypothetical protein